MTLHEDRLAFVAMTYGDARDWRGSDETAFELAHQCYNDLFPGHAADHVDREVSDIVKPVRDALAVGRSWRLWRR